MSNDEDLQFEIEATNKGGFTIESNMVIGLSHNYDKWTYNDEHYDFSRRKENSIRYDINYPPLK